MTQHLGSTDAAAPSSTGDKPNVGAEFASQENAINGQVPEAVLHLQSSVRSGVPWYRALLEAMGLWTLPSEVFQDRTYH